jgi:hypothetical protein
MMLLHATLILFQTSIITDSRFDAKQSFDESLLPVTEFCQKVSAKSGVSLRVAKNASDLKLDLFLKDQPLNLILDAVAKALNCEWVPDPENKGYKLEEPAVQVNRERNFVDAIDSVKREKALRTLWAQQYLAANMAPAPLGQNPESQRWARYYEAVKPFRDEYQRKFNSMSDAERQEYNEKLSALNEAQDQPLYVGRILNNFSKAEMKAFWTGTIFSGSDQPNALYRILSNDYLGRSTFFSSYQNTQGEFVNEVPETYFMFRWDTDSSSIQAVQIPWFPPTPNRSSFYSPATSSMFGSEFYTTTSDFLNESTKKMPFYQDLLPWLDQEKTPLAFTQLKKNKVPVWESPWRGPRRRLGEHLRWFHLTFEVPVVALADRSCTYNITSLNRGHNSATEYVADYMKAGEAFCKKEGVFLVARTGQFWEHRRHEAPESVWRRIEERLKQKKQTLRDTLWLTTQLNANQVGSYAMEYPLIPFKLWISRRNYNILRFLSTLSLNSIDAAMNVQGVSLDTVDPNYVLQTIRETAFLGGTVSRDLLQVLSKRGVSSADLRGLRLWIKSEDSQYSESGTDLTEYQGYDQDGTPKSVLLKKDEVLQSSVNSFVFKIGWDDKRYVSHGLLLPK